MLLTPWCGFLLATAPGPTAIVALTDAPEVVGAVQSISESWTRGGQAIESTASIATGLTGSAAPRSSDDAVVQRMLEDARDRDARFDIAGANALRRQILRSFDDQIRPTPAMRALAAAAGLDMAAALLGEGEEVAAAELAREVLRRFSAPIDSLRHPPATVSFFEAQRQAVASAAKVQVTVISDRAGTLFADGIDLGETDGRLVAELPAGRYRIWLAWPGRMSLPHPVQLENAAIQVNIDSALEAQIDFDEVVVASCNDSCAGLLAKLGQRLGVDRVVGVNLAASSAAVPPRVFRLLEVQTRSGEVRERQVTKDGKPAEETAGVLASDVMPRFSPKYLIPFGGGQFVQDRPLFGAAYLSIQAGLLAWYAWIRYSWGQAIDLGQVRRENDLRKRLDLSLGLFAGAVLGAVVEAVVVGWVAGE